MRVPTKIAAGDSPSWHDDPLMLPDQTPATPLTHALSFSFRGPIAGAKVDVNAVIDGGGWKTTLMAAQTSAWSQSMAVVIWFWQAYMTAIAGAARTLVSEGQVRVAPNLNALTGTAAFDGRSQTEQDLAAIQAAIRTRIGGGLVQDYSIGNRNLRREPMTALLELESRYKRLVAREHAQAAIKNGLGNPGKTFVRFTSR